MRDCVVMALGGNAILARGESGTVEEQTLNLAKTAETIFEVADEGISIVITHGNGPQIGAILIQNEAAKESVPPMPLDVCGAESQGMLGYMIERALRDAARGNSDVKIATILTQTLVYRDDPDFVTPSKPIGPFYDANAASRLIKELGYKMTEDSGRGWRRVVPSPSPIRVLEAPAIMKLVEEGYIVIANGGGGIPVLEEGGRLLGVEAVIDKDLSSQKLATQIDASTLLLLTDVRKVYLNYGQPDQTELDELSTEQARYYLNEGQFHRGSMEPKVRAALQFVEAGGRFAAIGSLEEGYGVLKGRAGTRVISARQ